MAKSKVKKPKIRRSKTKKLDVYQAMDLLDESQVVNDINGRVPDAAEKMVYSFIDKQTGREVVGLSWYGSKEAEREFNQKKLTQISITDKAIISQGNGYVDIGVYAYDSKRKMGSWGFSRGFDQGKRKDGSTYDDRFPSAKAASKAQRNAVNNLLPAEKVAKMIHLWIKKGQVQQIEGPKEPKIEVNSGVDHVSKLKIELYKMGAKNEKDAIKIVKDKTGLVWKSFDITNKQAQMALFMILNKEIK